MHRLPRAWDTASAALSTCAGALGDTRSPSEIAAASGLGWRISADAVVSLAGPHAYPFAEVLPAAAARLGYASEHVASSERPDGPLHADARRRAQALIARGLEAGRPTLVWGVHAPEFGLVVGAAGDQLQISGILDGNGPATLAADRLGRGDVPLLFALQLTGRLPLSDAEAERAALEAALLFGRGAAPILAGFHSGASAWHTVAAALESGRVDPAGFAYAAQRWAESRAAAAAWLSPRPALADAARATARAAAMLGELAALHPFPPPPGTMLTTESRDQAAELVAEAARAEAAALDAIAAHLITADERAAEALPIVDLDAARLRDLFACTRELPVAGLDDDAETCRERGRFSGKLIYEGDRLIAHVLWAPLDEARQPVAAEGRRWFVFCPWVAHERRGRGLGPRLFAALEAEARAAGVDGLLTFGTDDERFLYVESLARLGFVEAARRGDLHLFEKPLGETPSPSSARFVEASADSARVAVSHGYHCPLLLHTRRALAGAARATGLPVEESDQAAEGARIDGRDLPHGYIPPGALLAHLQTLR